VQIRITIKGTRLLKYIRLMPVFLREYRKLKEQAKLDNQDFPFGQLHPCFEDRSQESGTASGHYFHQDLLVADKIFKNNPTPSSTSISAPEWMGLFLT
jgi:hypothetical protein